MKKSWKLLPILFVFMVLLLASCSSKGLPTPLPTIVVDQACQGIVSHTFQSTDTFILGESEQESVYGPIMVAFLNDGRVVWKYSLTSYIGTFTCENGAFEASFTEGEKNSFEGTYNSETDMVRIEEINYLKATEE